MLWPVNYLGHSLFGTYEYADVLRIRNFGKPVPILDTSYIMQRHVAHDFHEQIIKFGTMQAIMVFLTRSKFTKWRRGAFFARCYLLPENYHPYT